MRIQAAVVEAPGGPFVIQELAMDPPGPGQVRIRIVACGVCHTDMVMRDGALPVPFPVIFGHEGAGVVDAVGPDVTGLEPGDHVLLSFDSCGECRSCHNHHPGYCDAFFPYNFLGQTRAGEGILRRGDQPIGANIFGQSAFANYAFAHPRNIVRVARDLPLATLAPLGCGVQTGAGTVLETLRVRPGESIAIFGAGAVGLSAVMAAKIAGAGRIAVLDRHTHRLSLAGELGATEQVTSVSDLTGSWDYIVDTTGIPALVAGCVERLGSHGVLALVGAYPPGATVPLDLNAVMSRGRRIIGVVEGGIDPQQFIPVLVEHYRAGRLPLEKLIRTFPFAEIEAAFDASKSGAVIKPVLVM